MGAEGVKWVTNNSSPTLTRYHGASGSNTLYSPASQSVATTYFNSLAPWGAMGRVSLRPDGSVSSRCNINTTPLQTGDNCYSDTDQTGSEQKMVYIPQFCYAVDTLTANQVWYWVGQVGDQFEKSDTSGTYTFSTSDIHPAFLAGGVQKSGIYAGAYEAYNSSSVLQSVAGVQPTAYLSISTLRGYANALNPTGWTTSNPGWGLLTMHSTAAVQLLYLIEYATWNSQTAIGAGITNLGSDHASNHACNTGHTATLGNASGASTGFTPENYSSQPTTYAVSFRGIENLWGNQHTFLDGANVGVVGNYDLWMTPDNLGPFSSSSHTSPYASPGYTLPTSAGYCIETWSLTNASYMWPFIAATTTGAYTMTVYICDDINTTTGNIVFTHGNDWRGSTAGGLFSDLVQSPNANYEVGARIQYVPS